MKTLFFKFSAICALTLFCFSPVINAAGPGGGGISDGGGGVGFGQTCYSTYNSCTIGCDSTLICDGGGECHREKVDSYSSRGDC